MAVETWLVDKSAYVRLGLSPDRETWADRISRGLVHISHLTLLEIGFSFRNEDDAKREMSSPPLTSLVVDFMTPKVERRALDIQRLLLADGQHRGVSIPDLLICAAAEHARHTVLHVDADFERIAQYTGQPVERLRDK